MTDCERTIAIVPPHYGMYLGDTTTGAFIPSAINPQSYSTNPYASLWGDFIYVTLSKIPIDKFFALPK